MCTVHDANGYLKKLGLANVKEQIYVLTITREVLFNVVKDILVFQGLDSPFSRSRRLYPRPFRD